MNYYTTETQVIKRSIINYANKITEGVGKCEAKFITQMIYGAVKSQSCILSQIADALKESNKKINTIERLSRNLTHDIPQNAEDNYFRQINKLISKEPVVYVDDTDIIKPCGMAFEHMGKVRDGSSKDNRIEKGYYVTEMVAVTEKEKQPVSLFSRIHSSHEKKYKSTNAVTFEGLNKVISKLNYKPVFVFDRGYDMNELYRYMHKSKQSYIVRLTERRKIFHKNKWYKGTTLRDARKGKIKTTLFFQNKPKDCYISYLNVKITADKKRVKLLLVYGLGDKPMMLITNKEIKSKDDAINIVRTYMSRWRIEEYFRFKKQVFGFEDIRVRTLKAMNNLNTLLSYAIAFITITTEKLDRNIMSIQVLCRSDSLKTKVQFLYYQMAKGIQNILNFARTGIDKYLKIEKRPKYIQLSFFKC